MPYPMGEIPRKLPDSVLKIAHRSPLIAELATLPMILAACETTTNQQLYILSVDAENISNTPYAQLGQGATDFISQHEKIQVGTSLTVLGISGETSFLVTPVLNRDGLKIATYEDGNGQIQNRVLIPMHGTVPGTQTEYVAFYPVVSDAVSEKRLNGEPVTIYDTDIGTGFYALTLKPGLKMEDFQREKDQATTPALARQILEKYIDTFMIADPNDPSKQFTATVSGQNSILDSFVGILTGVQPVSAAEITPGVPIPPTVTLHPTENPYATMNFFDQSTWTQAMKDAYAALPTRVTGEYTQENLTIHNGLSFGMVNYLESKGITTYSNWNETNFSDYSQYVKLYADFRNQVNSDPALTIEQKISPVNPWFIEQILTRLENIIPSYIDRYGNVRGGLNYSPLIATEDELINEFGSLENYFQEFIKFNNLRKFNVNLFGDNIVIDRQAANASIYLQKVIDISPNPYVPNSFIITGQLDDGAYYAFNVSVGDSPLPADTQVMISGQIVKLNDVAPGKQFIMRQVLDRQRTPWELTSASELVEYFGKPLVIDQTQGIHATDGSGIGYENGFVQLFGPLETFYEFHQKH